MDNFTTYINTPEIQTAGRIIFLLALALIMGSSLLAFISELTCKATAKADYPVRSHNITRSTWLWIILFTIIGGTIVFLPQAANITKSTNLKSAGLGSGIALLLFLLYHFTAKVIKIKALHAPLALLAAAAAKIAALACYLPSSFTTYPKTPATVTKLLTEWLQSGVMANFVHFTLNAVAISALFFMLANAKEKENKRRQPREYYFKASNFAGKWLFAMVTLQILPLGWLFYNFSTGNSAKLLFTAPLLYWFGGMIFFALPGWLLLIKINNDGLVNRRATFIIGLFFIISLCLLHFSPLNAASKYKPTPKTPTAAAVNPTTEPAADKVPTQQPKSQTQISIKPENRPTNPVPANENKKKPEAKKAAPQKAKPDNNQ